MFGRFVIALVLASRLSAPPLAAQDAPDAHAADHEQLRAILAQVRDAINSKDFASITPHLYSTFSATMIDQKVLTTREALTAYLDSLFDGDRPFITRLTMAPVADELTQIYDDRFGLVRGGNTETYELSTGNTITLQSRWTASLIKDQGQWKLLAIHNGVSFIDNPVLAAAGRFGVYLGIAGTVIGLTAGLIIAWYFRLARKPATAAS